MLLIISFLFGCSQPNIAEKYQTNRPESNEPLLETDLVTGQYAMELVTTRLMKNPFPGGDDWQPVQTVSIKLLDFTREGTDLRFVEQTCEVNIDEVFGTQSSLPSSFIDITSGRERTGYLESEHVGAVVTFPKFVDLNGVTMTNPESDVMPEDTEDQRIYDHDQDGNPGVTVNVDLGAIGGGEIYVAQRTHTYLQGWIVSPTRIEGNSDFYDEQFLIGASSWFLEVEQESEPDPDPLHNWFIIQHISPDWTCEDVVREKTDIFKP